MSQSDFINPLYLFAVMSFVVVLVLLFVLCRVCERLFILVSLLLAAFEREVVFVRSEMFSRV